MNLDGSGVQRVTFNAFSDTRPALSPDGTKIAFISNRTTQTTPDETELYIINVDGTGTQRLTFDGGKKDFPTWSPDGSKIAFYAGSSDNTSFKICKIDATGNNLTTLADGYDYEISWAATPAGEKIRFYALRVSNGQGTLYPVTMNPDGSGIQNAADGLYNTSYSADGSMLVGYYYDGVNRIQGVSTANSAVLFDIPLTVYPDDRPVFSADGKKIVFVGRIYNAQTQTDTGDEIFTINLNGTGLSRLTTTLADERDVSCGPGLTVPVTRPSAGSGRVVFDSYGDLWTMNPNGVDLVQLTQHDYAAVGTAHYRPAFSPDGTKIAYDNAENVFVMDADGANVVQLTHYPNQGYGGGTALGPVWSPDGTKLAYSCTNDASSYYYHNRVWTMNADGSNQHMECGGDVYPDPQNPPYYILDAPHTECFTPAWSVNGIITFGEGGGYYESGIGVKAYGAAATSQQIIVSNGAPNSYPYIAYGDPTWSADGSKIFLWRSIPQDGSLNYKQEIIQMNADGSGVVNLTVNPFANGGARVDSHPTASPDGQAIAFMRSGSFWQMDVNGANQRAIVPSFAFDLQNPMWGNNSNGPSADVQAPTLTVTDPVVSGSTKLLQVNGTVQDAALSPSGPAVVWLKLQRSSDNQYWNPATKTWGAAPALLPATLGAADGSTPPVVAWTAKNPQYLGPLPAPSDLTSGQHKLYAYAVDNAGNASAETTATFTVIKPGTLKFVEAGYQVNESESSVTLTVTRVGGSDGTVTVDYASSSYGDGTDATAGQATANQDYTPVSGTLSFGPGVTSQTITIPILPNTQVVGDRLLFVSLTNPTGQSELADQATTSVSIIDNDIAQVGSFRFSAHGYITHDSSGSTTITINRIGGSSGTVTLQLTSYTSDAVPRFTDVSGPVTFHSGETVKSVTIPLLGDSQADPNQVVYLSFYNSALGTAGSDNTTLTIINDLTAARQGSFQFGQTTFTVAQNAGTPLAIPITRTGGSTDQVTVYCRVNAADHGTAIENTDFVLNDSASITFADGDTATKSFHLTPESANPFSGTRTINLVLQDQYGVTISTATVTITGSGGASTTTVTVNVSGPTGSGTVTPALSGTTNHKVGDKLSVTAFAKPGFLFTGWTGDITPTSNKTLTFTVTPSMTITANFIANPFVTVTGTYVGLGDVAGALGVGNALFSIQVDPKGGFTAKITVGKLVYPFRGAFDTDGTFDASFTILKKDVDVSLQLDVVNGSNTVTGTITIAGVAYDVGGNRNVFSKAHPPSQAGLYTFVVPSPGGAGVPTGDSYFTATVKNTGKVTIIGALADGTTINRSGVLGADGSFALYASLYKNAGVFSTDVTFVYPRSTNAADSDVTGAAHWQRPVIGTDPAFNVQGQVLGSFYTKPANPLTTVFGGAAGNVLLHFVTTPAINDVTAVLATNGKATAPASGFTFKAANASGKFTGKAPSPLKNAAFQGVVLQKQGVGRGFVAKDATGQVTVTPQ